jgi:predicted DNA-binding mobile mystery protein A
MSKNLQKRQLEKTFEAVKVTLRVEVPPKGWIHAIREALAMPLHTLAERMKITPSGVRDIERRESDGSITLRTLRQAAAALNCRVVYFVVPNEPLDKMIDHEAIRAAKRLIEGVAQTMTLESQATTTSDQVELLQDTLEILRQKPSLIWRALR